MFDQHGKQAAMCVFYANCSRKIKIDMPSEVIRAL
jgi:hypothetical protein